MEIERKVNQINRGGNMADCCSSQPNSHRNHIKSNCDETDDGQCCFCFAVEKEAIKKDDVQNKIKSKLKLEAEMNF